MNEKIDTINRSIEEKCCLLKDKVNGTLSSLNTTTNIEVQQNTGNHLQNKVPPMSYILYGITGLSLIRTIVSESKMLSLCIAAACGLGGYKLSKARTMTPLVKDEEPNFGSLKNDVLSKVVNTVKTATNEWEDFMELKQKEIQNEISMSSFEDGVKDSLLSKVYLYEVIDISISELSSLINISTNTLEIRQAIDQCKVKIISEIENASARQISKYNSLVLEITNCL